MSKVFDINSNCFFPKPKINSTLLEFTPKKKLIKNKKPKNIEYITKIFFNQRRKMIKKNFIKLFRDFNQFANKINIKLTDRPQKIPVISFNDCTRI